MYINNKDVLSSDLNEMNLDDVKPLDNDWIPIEAKAGDKIRFTMQGLGRRELILIEIVRKPVG